MFSERNHMAFMSARSMAGFFAAALISLSVSSCKKDTGGDGTEGKDSTYVVSVRTGDDDGTTDYVLATQSIMDGEISVDGVGIEQPGWNYYFANNNIFFSINYGEEGTIAYVLGDDKKLKEKGRFWVEALDCMGAAEDGNMVGIGAPWGGGSYDCELMVIDADDISVSSRRFDRLYVMSASDTLNKWPTGAIVRGDKLYVSFYPLDGESWDTPIMDTAYVSIFKYPSLEYVKTIKDTRTAPIGMYGSVSSIIKTENGDIYSISPASLGAGYTKTGNPSGLLRIKNNEDKFDESYFLNFETSSIHAKVIMLQYIANNKALIRYIPLTTDAALPMWAYYSQAASVTKLAIIDLNTSAITPITDIPDHSHGYARNIFVENGKAYYSITSSVTNEARIYEIDPVTATAKKGALIKGLEAPLIYKLTN